MNKINTISYDIEKVRKQFPVLQTKVWDKPLTYLDSAASMQKPKVVLDCINQNYLSNYSNVHRGLHLLSEKSTEQYENARNKVANFLNANVNEIIFTSGATSAINLVAYSWGKNFLKENDEVIVTIAEHHANFVPWQYITRLVGAKLKIAFFNPDEEFDIDEIKKLVTEKTRLIAFPHVSNVLGTIFPVKQICNLAQDIGAISVVDGCQGAIHFPVNVKELNCDFYCFSGHKLYGPTGIGILYGKTQILTEMPPFMCGGDMIDNVSIEKTTYADPPLRFEAGTPPFVQAIGLGKAIDWVNELGLNNIYNHEKKVISYGIEKLNDLEGIKIFGKNKNKAGVISFMMSCAHSHDVATIVDREGIAVRAGHHCAQPLLDAHDVVSTTRASVGAYTSFEDFDKLIEALKKVKKIFGE